MFVNLVLLGCVWLATASMPLIVQAGSPEHEQLVDKLTSMFYHIEHTRKCGDNLQRFGVDLNPFWSSKFLAQTEKTFALANSLNHLISNMNTEPAASTSHKSNEIQIIESNLLPALSYFLFTRTNDKAGSLVYKSTSSQMRLLNEAFAKPPQIQYDPFLLGFGVLLFYDVENNVSEYSDTTKKTIKCFYLYTKSNLSEEIDASNLIRNKSCSSLNLSARQDKTAADYIESDTFSFHFSDKSFSGNGNTQDLFKNCNNWFAI